MAAKVVVPCMIPFSGDQLRKQGVSFEKLKLTNNTMDKNGHVRNFYFQYPFTLTV